MFRHETVTTFLQSYRTLFVAWEMPGWLSESVNRLSTEWTDRCKGQVHWQVVDSESWVSFRVSTTEDWYAYGFLLGCICLLLTPILKAILCFVFWEGLIPYAPGKGGWLMRCIWNVPWWILRQVGQTLMFAMVTSLGLMMVLGMVYTARSFQTLSSGLTFLHASTPLLPP